jgi:hypothetical protein
MTVEVEITDMLPTKVQQQLDLRRQANHIADELTQAALNPRIAIGQQLRLHHLAIALRARPELIQPLQQLRRLITPQSTSSTAASAQVTGGNAAPTGRAEVIRSRAPGAPR